MSSTTLKKLALGFIILWVLAFALSRFGEYYIKKNTPSFLVQMEETLPESPYLLARLGEDAAIGYTYNENDLSTDTLKYSFSLHGSEGAMQIKGYATKRQGNWVPIKSDTLFTKN